MAPVAASSENSGSPSRSLLSLHPRPAPIQRGWLRSRLKRPIRRGPCSATASRTGGWSIPLRPSSPTRIALVPGTFHSSRNGNTVTRCLTPITTGSKPRTTAPPDAEHAEKARSRRRRFGSRGSLAGGDAAILGSPDARREPAVEAPDPAFSRSNNFTSVGDQAPAEGRMSCSNRSISGGRWSPP